MRRQSFSSSLSSGSGGAGEPLIVVEESTQGEEEEEAEKRRSESPPRCLDPDSPSLNPYLLSPWREARKHSLPTPQCTSGITASQVRRLSERGGEGSGPSPREAAFLATLSQSQPPQPGGRRHSVVTISRVPPTLFGRNRRESIAAFPMTGATRILASRRDSATGLPSGPPSNSGSTHNLQLDIMDDIAEIKAARKVRLKMWKTPSHERVCEVQPLEGNGAAVAQRYTQNQQRRYSDFALTTIPATIQAGPVARRRASEMPSRLGPLVPPPIPPRTIVPAPIPGTASASCSSGIVCTNTDLISILSSLTSSATEIDRCGRDDEKDARQSNTATTLNFSSTSTNVVSTAAASTKTVEQKRNRLKSSRSNSFDVSILHGCESEGKQSSATGSGLAKNNSTGTGIISASSWFTKRHQPMAKKQRNGTAGTVGLADLASSTLSFKFEKSRVVKAVRDTLGKTSPTKDEARNKVVWDGSSGTKVDAQVLGNAIEEFLRSSVGGGEQDAGSQEGVAVKASGILSPGKPARSNSWFSAGSSTSQVNSSASPPTPGTSTNDEQQSDAQCEPSICSSLKDLFVK